MRKSGETDMPQGSEKQSVERTPPDAHTPVPAQEGSQHEARAAEEGLAASPHPPTTGLVKDKLPPPAGVGPLRGPGQQSAPDRQNSPERAASSPDEPASTLRAEASEGLAPAQKDAKPTNGQAPELAEGSAKPSSKPKEKPEPVEAGAQPGLAPAPEDEKPALGSQAIKPAAGSANPASEPEPVKAGEQRPTDPEDPDDVMTRRIPGSEAADAAVLAQSRLHTRRSFLGALAGTAAGYGVYAYLNHAPEKEMLASPIRGALNVNGFLNREIFHYYPLAPTYPLSRAETLRINGVFGLKKELKLDTWRLQVVGVRGARENVRYVKDVTTWNYRYHGETSGLSANHDTKEAPKPGDAPAPAQGQPGQAQPGGDTQVDPKKSSADKMAPAGMVDKAKADENKSQDSADVKARHGKAMPSYASSTKMAPMSMLKQAMADEMPKDDDDDDQGEDDNHLGRKPRGQEESGESDSTIRAGTPGLLLVLDDLVKLPRHEFVTQFKCIEGWSQIVRWAGVRMADFLNAYPPELIDGKEPEYVYMETPDGDYYTGYRLRELRHPQALLVTEMMGAPLEQLHGAPLRLHMPNKYGYKQIKRIGLIAYTNDKPDDYWTKLGYDWYADL